MHVLQLAAKPASARRRAPVGPAANCTNVEWESVQQLRMVGLRNQSYCTVTIEKSRDAHPNQTPLNKNTPPLQLFPPCDDDNGFIDT